MNPEHQALLLQALGAPILDDTRSLIVDFLSGDASEHINVRARSVYDRSYYGSVDLVVAALIWNSSAPSASVDWRKNNDDWAATIKTRLQRLLDSK